MQVTGYITLKKYLVGRTLQQIETLLGFHEGRLSQGATFAELINNPGPNDFELAGYSQVASHRFNNSVLSGLDVNVLKNNVLAAWNSPGEKLVKVLADVRHNPQMSDDYQYPPGAGVPQWKLVVPQIAIVTSTVNDYPNGTYRS